MGDYGNIQVFLGDGRTSPQRERLTEALAEIFERDGWTEVGCIEAERFISVGRAARWLTLFDSFQLECSEEHDAFCIALSRHFPLVSLRWWSAPSADQAALALALYRDGACSDCVARGHLAEEKYKGQRGVKAGHPAAWGDLLGTRRNSARLELVWGASSRADEVLEATVEIVGFDTQLCRRGSVDAGIGDEAGLRVRLERNEIDGWNGLGFSRR